MHFDYRDNGVKIEIIIIIIISVVVTAVIVVVIVVIAAAAIIVVIAVVASVAVLMMVTYFTRCVWSLNRFNDLQLTTSLVLTYQCVMDNQNVSPVTTREKERERGPIIAADSGHR